MDKQPTIKPVENLTFGDMGVMIKHTTLVENQLLIGNYYCLGCITLVGDEKKEFLANMFVRTDEFDEITKVEVFEILLQQLREKDYWYRTGFLSMQDKELRKALRDERYEDIT